MLKTLPVIAALLAAGALVVPTVSQAASGDSVRVSYADLNLTTEFDQARLQRRISFAAAFVCGAADHRDIPFTQAVGECRSATIADVQPAYQAAVANARVPSVTVLDSAALIVTAH
jgi:UrcA family protein